MYISETKFVSASSQSTMKDTNLSYNVVRDNRLMTEKKITILL